VNAGEIQLENVSRRFRVYPQRNITLKEAVVRWRHLKPEEIWALRDVSLRVEPGTSIGFVGRNGSGKTTLLRLIAGIFGPTSGRIEVGGSVGSLLELGAGFHPDFTGRENVYLSGSIYGLKRREVHRLFDEIVSFSELDRFIDFPVRTYSSGMLMRLGFSIAVNVKADVLLLDEVFAVGDEAFQRKCVDQILGFTQKGGTLCFVSHAASAVEHLCERTVLLSEGRVEFDGETEEALRRYHALLAAEQEPMEVGAELRESGTGELRIAGLAVEGADGVARDRFIAGESISIRTLLEADVDVPTARLSLELRDLTGALLGASHSDLAELGWPGSPGIGEIRFSVDRLPLAEGTFQIGVTLVDADGSHRYHRVDRAAQFVVSGTDSVRGPLLLEGEWTLAGAQRNVGAA
jgi:ABC-type polysaccharide/polyol phosphate transport system ATPase subunit